MSGFGPPQSTGGGTADNTIEVQDEGVTEGTVTTVNFTGPGSSVSVAGDTATVNVTGGGGGGSGSSYFPSGW